MTTFEYIALILSLTAIFNVVSERILKLPKVIGPMMVALLSSMIIFILDAFSAEGLLAKLEPVIREVDFSAIIIDGLLGFLLFAGAMHVPIRILDAQRLTVFKLSIVSTLVSTFVVGGLLWLIVPLLGYSISFLHALIFGALISPTDPVAVLAILKNAALPRRLEVIISGESLFNDAIGMVLFIVLSALAFSEQQPTLADGAVLAATEVLGGLFLGCLVGTAAYYMLQQTQEHSTHVLITLAVATGGYALAQGLHTSGPLAMVAAGLIVGNAGLRETMDRDSRKLLVQFWSVTDDVANATLFVLIGLEVLLLPEWVGWELTILAISVHLLGRGLGVTIPTLLFRKQQSMPDAHWWSLVGLLTWSGLRGGVSVALVLTLPPGDLRDAMLGMTYIIVLFSVIVQGLSINKVFNKYGMRDMVKRARQF
jgi:Na+:H+ antiporter